METLTRGSRAPRQWREIDPPDGPACRGGRVPLLQRERTLHCPSSALLMGCGGGEGGRGQRRYADTDHTLAMSEG